VTPESRARLPKVTAFRDWIMDLAREGVTDCADPFAA
jgi:hypothetical protein